jgi:hypothetical protein
MGNTIPERGIVVQFPRGGSVACDPGEKNGLDVVTAELRAALVRIKALQEENGDLKQCQDTLVQEFERRLVNGVQVIESLLPGRSQTAAPGPLTVKVCPWTRNAGNFSRSSH